MKGTCRHCERPVYFASRYRVWLHSESLSELRISPQEQEAVLRANQELGHDEKRVYNLIHRASPKRSSEWA